MRTTVSLDDDVMAAVDETSPFHDRAASWMTERLNGSRQVGLSWRSLVPSSRPHLHEPRAAADPLDPEVAWVHAVLVRDEGAPRAPSSLLVDAIGSPAHAAPGAGGPTLS